MTARQRPLSQEYGSEARSLREPEAKPVGDIVEHKPARRQRLGAGPFRRLLKKGMLLASLSGAILLVYWTVGGGHAARLTMQKEHVWQASCPNYVQYAARKHEPLSEGPLELPFQRPIEECRTFKSEQVEKVVADITKKLADKDLARLFENCFPNTLDTTIRWHSADAKNPQTFIITGDINAEWLRDSTNQLAPYADLLLKDKRLALLFRGAITTQADFVTRAPYCNAFQPPLDSKINPVSDHTDDKVHPIYDPTDVFECKYELDSLASFLKLSWMYYDQTKELDFVTPTWLNAITRVLEVIEEQSEPTFDTKTGLANFPRYTFQRNTNIGTETLALSGAGNPLNANTSLVRSAFRPSDDATILQFLVPSNAFMSVELGHLSEILRQVKHHTSASEETITFLAEKSRTMSTAIATGIKEHAIFEHPLFSRVYAYEVDGYGGRIFMDDANLPSLLSLPLLGFVDRHDPIYQNTRKMVLSSLGNPYFLQGERFKGIGGPHIGTRNAWPMSVLVQIMTSDDDDEIIGLLEMLKTSTAQLGLMHETVNVRRTWDFTRPWFAWANGLFGEMILDLIARKPELITDKAYKHTRD